jgi:hypothetical protein
VHVIAFSRVLPPDGMKAAKHVKDKEVEFKTMYVQYYGHQALGELDKKEKVKFHEMKTWFGLKEADSPQVQDGLLSRFFRYDGLFGSFDEVLVYSLAGKLDHGLRDHYVENMKIAVKQAEENARKKEANPRYCYY